ncbi:DUF3152 domain-containing protein [Streptomyces griseocarneus]|uniref:DUF3152 domain-containing protein n=1 Tax=Streptomyces griseocarneus TaxID=51201 RepID=UPI00167D3282|nr:DUF3152 domain-containing protein [Streptomyces griseocarneus]GHG57538.1 hypothetical protein GCM10018779_22660 [Streptomyces griseocarneus]
MGKHSARADRPRQGSAAGSGRVPDGPGTSDHGPGALPPVPGPGSGRRRGGASGDDAAVLAADFDAGFGPDLGPGFDAGFGPDYDAGFSAGLRTGSGPDRDAAGREQAAGWGVIGAQRAQAAPAGRQPSGPTHSATGFSPGGPAVATRTRPAAPDGRPGRPRGRAAARAESASRGPGGAVARTVTGVAAAVVTAVLAVTVAGQVEETTESKAQARSMDVGKRGGPDAASRSDSRPTPNGGVAIPATYEQKMARAYPLDAKASATGEFETVEGGDKAPGKGEVLRYRVDVEKGLPLDGALFASAVHRTLNDDRSWGHGGKRTFERVSSGKADFVVTLASPGTTATWCAKSGLDTTEDNVSCDSAATDRVMINAYRWAQGSQTYGDRMHLYREMLINHEVGHRLGHDHESCSEEGALAPVMMQQTKFLTTDGKTCRPNPWPHPEAAGSSS